MKKKLSLLEKQEMYNQIDSLSLDNLHLLAENDPIIDGEQMKAEFNKTIDVNSSMQCYSNSLEAQKNFNLQGEGVPDIKKNLAQARENAAYYRTNVVPKINNNYTDLKSTINLITTVDENWIKDLVKEAVNSQAGKDNLSALMQTFSGDSRKNYTKATEGSSLLGDFNTRLNTDLINFLKNYDIIEAIFNDYDGKRAKLRKLMDEYLAIIQDLTSQIIVLSVISGTGFLLCILAAVLDVITAGLAQTIIGALVGVTTTVVADRLKKRDEYQEKYNNTSAELAYLNQQCALATTFKDNFVELANYLQQIIPQIGAIARLWNTIAENYKKIQEYIDAGLDSNKAIIVEVFLITAFKTALDLLPLAKRYEQNQLLPVQVNNNLMIDLQLPPAWANKPIAPEVFFDYLKIRRYK